MRKYLSQSLLLLLLLFISCGFMSAGVLLGDQNVEIMLDYNPTGVAQAWQTTAITIGTVGSLALYVDATSTASQIVLGLYNDSGGHPYSLLTQAAFLPQAGAWNTIAVPAANVVAGAPYWIAVLGVGSGAPYFRDTKGPCISEGSSSATLSSLPSTWSTGVVWGACPVSAYGAGVIATTTSPVAVSISPNSASLLAGGSQQFTASVTGSTNTSVTWSTTDGTMSSSGLYTAPTTSGTYTVTATSVADITNSASATVTVSAPIQHTVTLTWTPGTSGAVAGYNVYRGTVSGGPYSQINTVLDVAANYVDNTAQSGHTYYYVATSVNSSGVESAYSSEVNAVIPTP